MHAQYTSRKIVQPNLPPVILHRTALINILQDIIDPSFTQSSLARYKLVLLSAPAGYGKTTLLADLAQHTRIPCCWYFLDQMDTDPLTFIDFLTESIRQKFPAFGSTLEGSLSAIIANDMNYTTQIQQLEYLVDTLASLLEIDVSGNLAIFLCNYQEINAKSIINRFVNRLINRLPPHVTLIIESRSLPSLEIASLVAQRQVFGLGSNQLRFTPRDIQNLTHLQGIQALPEEEANQLATSFDGWIAGILLGTRLGGVPFLPSSATNEQQVLVHNNHDQQYLFAYLVEEVFKKEPEVFSFLKETSLLSQMTPELCNALLHSSDAAARLEYIEQQGLFVTCSNNGKQLTYTCHPILRELLYAEFRKQAPEQVTELHIQAARLAYADEEYDQAISHALAARAYELASTIMEEIATSMLRQGHAETLRRWIDLLPTSIFEQSARLLLARATIHTTRHEVSQSLELLKHAQELAQHCPEGSQAELDSLLAEILIAQASSLSETGDYLQAQQKCLLALTLLSVDERELRARAYQRLGMCVSLLGDFQTGISHMHQALQLWGHSTEILQTALLHGNLANAYNMLGNYTLSEYHRARAIASCEHLGDKRGKLNNLIGMAITMRNKGSLDEAIAMLQEALAMAREEQLQSGEAYALENLGEIYQDQGEFSIALPMLEDALALARQLDDSYLINSALCILALIYLFMGDAQTATFLVEQVDAHKEDTASYAGALRELTRGTIYLIQHDYQRSLHSLITATTSFEKAGLKRLYLRSLIRLAACYLALKQQDKVISVLEKSAALASQGTYEHIALLELGRFADLQQAIQILPRAIRLRIGSQDPSGLAGDPITTVLSTQHPSSNTDKLCTLAFGEPAVLINGTSITRWRMSRCMELYFFLLDRNRAIRKEIIIEQLWPEIDDRVEQTLRSTIYYLRKAIGENCIIFSGGAYILDLAHHYESPIRYDVALFEQFYKEGKQALRDKDENRAKKSFQEMTQLYRGDYVQSFYSNWCSQRRDELRLIYIDVRRKLARLAWQEDALDECIDHWQHMLVVDDCLEEAHYGLMRSYARQGKRSLALRQYQRCADILQTELAVSPGPTIQKFYQQLMARND